MAYLLHILVAVTMISLCSAQCTTEHNGKIGFNAHKHSVYGSHEHGCWKDDNFHQVGHTWRSSDCTSCTCFTDHVTCCVTYAMPILTDPKNCHAILNKDTCKYEVKRIDNSEEICEVDSWIA